MICKATKNNPPYETWLHSYSAQRVIHDRSIRKRLLLCIRTTIGVGVKQLVVPHANHYSFALRTTTGLSANNYYFYFHSRPQLLHATSSGKACLHMDATALRKDTSPLAAAGGDDALELSALTRASGAPAPGLSVG